MNTINSRVYRNFSISLILIALSVFTLAPAVLADAKTDGAAVINGFTDLVENLQDLSATVAVTGDGGSLQGMSLSFKVSLPQNMLFIELKGNPLVDGMKIIFDSDAKLVYFISPSIDEVYKVKLDQASDMFMMMGLNMDLSALDSDSMSFINQIVPVDLLDDYDLAPIGFKTAGDTDVCLIKITPKDNPKTLSYQVIWVNTLDYHLVKVEQHNDEQGTISTVDITESEYNSGLTKADFLAPLEGKDIIEMEN